MQNFNFGAALQAKILPNKLYASLLMPLLWGPCGEVASFFQFSYQSALLVPLGAPAGQHFEEIFTADLQHQKILAQCIVLLGGNPHPKHLSGPTFSTKQIAPFQDTKNMLISGIELKEQSIIACKSTLLKIKNPTLKSLLNAILFDEQNHLQTLKKLAHSLNLNAN